MDADRLRIVGIALVLAAAGAAATAGTPEETKALRAQLDGLQRTAALQQAKVAELQKQLAEKDARIGQLEAVCRKAGVDLPGPKAPAGLAAPKLAAIEQAYLAEARRQRAAAVRRAERQIRELGAHMARVVQGKIDKRSPGIVVDVRTGAYTFPSAEQRGRKMRQVQERISKLNKRRDELKKNDPPFVPALRGGFAVGRAGRFEHPVTVRQIIDKTNMLVEAAIDVSPAGSGMWAVQKLSIWLSGLPTEGLVDDVEVDLRLPLEITGTRQYRPPTGGLKTVFVASPFDSGRVDQVLQGGR